MSTFEIVKKLADAQKISIVELEEKLDFSKNSLYSWKKNKPSAEKLEKVADYFNVSTDYLLGRTDNRYFGLSEEQRDRTVDEALNSVMSYDGEPVTEHDREILKGIIEGYLNNKAKE
ncbi:helix-turn-helix domain-containing protein [Enterococcus sp. LJL99]